MTDHRWAFCSDPECLLCATHAPRRDVPAEPDSPAARVSERLSHFRTPGSRAVDWRPTDELTDFINKYRLPPMRDADASRSDHVHWATGPQQAPRPWYLRAATRLFRMQPINTVRDRVRVYFEPRDVWVGVYVSEDAVYVCLLPCLVIRWRR